MNNRTKIVLEATRNLAALTGVNLIQDKPKSLKINEKDHFPLAADAELLFEFKGRRVRFFATIRSEIREMHLPLFLENLNNNIEERLLVCRYIPKPVKNELRNKGINYLDGSGNCFIRREEMYFFINDQVVTPARSTPTGKLWKPAGLKFIFVVLQLPDLLNGTYRQLAAIAGIALGNIGIFIEELKTAGFIGKYGDRLVFQDKEQLLQRWVEAYHTNLRPKLQLGRFRFLNAEVAVNWRDARPGNYYWGGEAAGALFTNFLRPEIFTVYTSRQIEVIKAMKVIPDENGPHEILQIFWNEKLLQIAGPKNTVPPLLAYADLIAHKDSRNRETAARIKQQYLE